jgi:hypothetical protein
MLEAVVVSLIGAFQVVSGDRTLARSSSDLQLILSP